MKQLHFSNTFNPIHWRDLTDTQQQTVLELHMFLEGKQMTICFHVDDCKLSHRMPHVMDQMIGWLHREYESIFEDGTGQMKVNRGKVQKYLGMTWITAFVVKWRSLWPITSMRFYMLSTRQTQMGRALRQVLHPRVFSGLTKTARSHSQKKLWHFTTWWPWLCMPPNMLGGHMLYSNCIPNNKSACAR